MALFKDFKYKIFRLLRFGCLVLIYGCVSMSKEEQTANLISPPDVKTSIENGLSSGYFNLGDWPQQNWWEIFNSNQLNHLIVEALKQNPTIQGIERRVELAKQTAKVVRSRLFPLIFFNLDETWEYLSHNGLYRALNPEIPINANLIDLTLSFNYEFDFWGKNRNLFQSALGQSRAAQAESAQVQLITATSIAQAFFALKTNLTRKRLYEDLLDVRSNIFELQKLLLEKALLSKLDPLLSEEYLLQAEQWVLSIEEEIETDCHLINTLLGRGPNSPLKIQEGLEPFTDQLTIPENLSLDLLARRPDLMAQIWRVEALAHEVGAAKADFFPNINLKAFAGLESIAYHLLLQSRSKTASLEPAIHLPIFTAGAIRANIRAKKALFDEAVFDYNNLILRSAQEVADLLILAQTIFKQKGDQEQIVKAATSRLDLISLRIQKGLDNQLKEYYVQEELIQKQLEDVSLTYNQYLAAIKLIKALGGGYQSEYQIPLKAKEGA
jgi:NodT family efflux transporter outer membrane factor (OMF) lipoprotein